jgi:hypothetical protein
MEGWTKSTNPATLNRLNRQETHTHSSSAGYHLERLGCSQCSLHGVGKAQRPSNCKHNATPDFSATACHSALLEVPVLPEPALTSSIFAYIRPHISLIQYLDSPIACFGSVEVLFV